MKKYTKEQAIATVVSCAENYRKELEGRKLLFLCRDKHKKITYYEFAFYDRNFLHLTGLKPNTSGGREPIRADEFYRKCIHKKLRFSDFEFAKDGTTPLKLEVLPNLMTKNLSAKMVGEYHSSRPKLYTEKLAGGIKGCVGFVTDKVHGEYVPNTVLNEDIRNSVNHQAQVIAVFRTKQKENLFSEITYIAKGVVLSDIELPREVQDKLTITM